MLGAGKGALAKTTSRAALSVAGGLCAVIVSLLLALRDTYPRLYSQDERVIAVASSLTYVYAFYQTLTSLNFCLGGILNGCGRQQISANIGIVAWYIVGLPGGALLCFTVGLEIVGLWLGLSLGLMLSVAVLSCTVARQNWDAQAKKAAQRAK